MYLTITTLVPTNQKQAVKTIESSLIAIISLGKEFNFNKKNLENKIYD